MKKKVIFRGVGTALITPFRNGSVDEPTLYELIDRQIAAGVDAIVFGGTTGEAATLTDEERYRLYARAMEHTAGRVKTLLGVGTNDTAKTLIHARFASSLATDGLLAVTPYYNKGTESGIERHFLRLADAASVPVMLYNVPSRTGVNLSLGTLERLSEHENIVGIKEAADSAERLTDLAAFGEDLWLYAGNDSQTYTALALGGQGVISVVSNLYPEKMRNVTDLYREGRHAESRKAQLKLLPLIRAMFCETNPAPLKFAMSRLGLCSAEMRLPMDLPNAGNREKILSALDPA